MRINVFIASAAGLSRRAADRAITDGRVGVNGQHAAIGQTVTSKDTITLDGQVLKTTSATTTIMLNKPVGYVCSRQGQGNRTVYDLLPAEFRRLKPVGRLDKDSSGLLLMTDDGQLANHLTHPRYGKLKTYQVTLNKPLSPTDQQRVEQGVELEDGISKLQIKNVSGRYLTAILGEGRNRQVRRTFAALGYTVTELCRSHFGDYGLPPNLSIGNYKVLSSVG
jgi:23S rRNA pseudouridine2605 synthase